MGLRTDDVGKGLDAGGHVISLSQIQCFVKTVDHGSVTAAARALGISPQAVSKSVNDLERSLDRTLFVRRASGLKPTPYGLTFCKKARRMLEEAQELEEFSQGKTVANRHSLVLLLCIPKTANFSSLSQRIGSFLDGRLGVNAVVDHSSFDQCVEKLVFGEADAFITVGKTVLDDFEVNVIDAIDVGALVTENHPLAKRRVLRLEDMTDCPLYFTPDFPFFNKTVLDGLKRSDRASELRLKRLAMSLQGLFDALVFQKGCIVMPTIQGVNDWLPSSTTVPFDAHEVSRVPLCLVTAKEEKTEFAKAIEALLVRRRGEPAAVSRAALGTRTK